MFFRNTLRVTNGLNPDQDQRSVQKYNSQLIWDFVGFENDVQEPGVATIYNALQSARLLPGILGIL